MAYGLKWIEDMLNIRLIKTTLHADELYFKTAKGCLQGEAISPLLWSIVADSLIFDINNQGYETYGCADDIASFIKCKLHCTIFDIVRGVLKVVESW